ncbi:hypothetical protein OKE80_09930 [Riemerella anatipestifer]|uniref:Uncharacterized protein n=1 Tax=Riemerella anatipestifer TaxID=34085 RepID=A0AAP3ANF1_RIEAN|nr:hypothetical protein [Riemerella anatipestifer]MBT0574309.1 hypothetical protein [Riemerella anatipestifer]MCO7319642.1 hypothetical protein [Riemerella anatipestifer]MCQ4155889.1 hypothetical protein [Riemerella anatipestifer]MCQ4181891.1 hypothetical protein [Riemerella anatipestifer]MCT6723671.1 hypothetical protein [Riemerella anatipestifer]
MKKIKYLDVSPTTFGIVVLVVFLLAYTVRIKKDVAFIIPNYIIFKASD